MIGNDIIDLRLARIESNWRRKGFLDKIFTKNEQISIQNSINQDIMVWNLWSRKEASYKIYNRETGIRSFNPIQFECFGVDLKMGWVNFKNEQYFTKTQFSKHFIHTISVLKKSDLKKIKILKKSTEITKENNIPFYFNEKLNSLLPISKSHHGNFEKTICLNNS
ncbi:4'-phosphopantetheinyl transferase superfamily protein [Flavobacterium sp.]|uniref:4'-phosphopantetheinyl transferase family protein n=1 Tax=Flavobacterium sp. TaxID=239 RepID=UPI00375393D7